MDCSLPSSSVGGIIQAKILEWVAISSSRGSSQPRDRTHVSCISCIGKHVLYQQCHLGTKLASKLVCKDEKNKTKTKADTATTKNSTLPLPNSVFGSITKSCLGVCDSTVQNFIGTQRREYLTPLIFFNIYLFILLCQVFVVTWSLSSRTGCIDSRRTSMAQTPVIQEPFQMSSPSEISQFI